MITSLRKREFVTLLCYVVVSLSSIVITSLWEEELVTLLSSVSVSLSTFAITSLEVEGIGNFVLLCYC